MSVQEFTVALGSIFEHFAVGGGARGTGAPFGSRERLHEAMCQQVAQASAAEQDALILAHPKLGARGPPTGAADAGLANEQTPRGAGCLLGR
ncbi:MAG: 2-oxo-4-hydroxy-4-carboxy-5-ureidoimidazoline decarboxylase [Steroidobacteraceae bacterium]